MSTHASLVARADQPAHRVIHQLVFHQGRRLTPSFLDWASSWRLGCTCAWSSIETEAYKQRREGLTLLTASILCLQTWSRIGIMRSILNWSLLLLSCYHCEVPCLHLPQISRTINNDHPTDQGPLVMSLLLVSRHFGDVGRALHTGVELT